MKKSVDQILECVCCQNDTPTQGKRICPLCGHVFQGNGWDGIDAHWRAHHEAVMAYEQFWQSMCSEHRKQIENYKGTRPIGLYRWDLECLVDASEYALNDLKEYPDKSDSGYRSLLKLHNRLKEIYRKAYD